MFNVCVTDTKRDATGKPKQKTNIKMNFQIYTRTIMRRLYSAKPGLNVPLVKGLDSSLPFDQLKSSTDPADIAGN